MYVREMILSSLVFSLHDSLILDVNTTIIASTSKLNEILMVKGATFYVSKYTIIANKFFKYTSF